MKLLYNSVWHANDIHPQGGDEHENKQHLKTTFSF